MLDARKMQVGKGWFAAELDNWYNYTRVRLDGALFAYRTAIF